MMGRLALLLVAAVALLTAGVWALVKMGAPAWFTLTFAVALAGVTIVFFWPALVAGLVGFLVLRAALWRARRQDVGGRRRRRWKR